METDLDHVSTAWSYVSHKLAGWISFPAYDVYVLIHPLVRPFIFPFLISCQHFRHEMS
jgi:hypothetical protein